MQFTQFLERPLVLTGTAGIMLVWIAAMSAASMIEASSLPNAPDRPQVAANRAADPAAEPAASFPANTGAERWRSRCDECAIIESVRRIAPAGTAPATYEITVRLRDGSTRVNHDPSPASWRIGERIIYIEGPNPARS